MNIGLFLSELAPIIHISTGYNAAIGENILIARPDSPQFSFGSFRTADPMIFISLTCGSILAPSPTAILIAARESSQYDGLWIILSPSASNAAAIALCVMLFEVGAFIVPSIADGSTYPVSYTHLTLPTKR